MEKFNKNIFYEICKYLVFYEMRRFRWTCKTIKAKVEESMVILAEREVNRTLIPRENLYVSKKKEKESLKNEDWLKFLFDQIKERSIIKHRIYHVSSSLFPEIDEENLLALTKFMYVEIKRKRTYKVTMKKSKSRSGVTFTVFQDLVSHHSKGQMLDKYSKTIFTGVSKNNEQEIVENNEVELFKKMREYEDIDVVCEIEPKSSILAFMYLVNRFLKLHCKTLAKSIESN
jgi:hypothetical protein